MVTSLHIKINNNFLLSCKITFLCDLELSNLLPSDILLKFSLSLLSYEFELNSSQTNYTPAFHTVTYLLNFSKSI